MTTIFLKKNSDNSDLKRFMDDAYVTSPLTDEIFAMITALHSTVQSKPRCGLLYGPTDYGKTAAVRKYIRDYLKTYKKVDLYIDDKPILQVTLSSASTKQQLLTLALHQLGDIAPSKGTLSEKEERLQTQIKNLNTSLLVIDDFGRLLRDSGISFNKTMAHYIQYFLDELLQIPILLVGVDDCKVILDELHELERRTPYKYRLQEYRMDNDRNTNRFIRFLKTLQAGIPKKVLPLYGDKMAKRFLLASNGSPGPIKTLIEQACMISGDDSQAITLDHFETAYDKIHEASEQQESKENILKKRPLKKVHTRKQKVVIDTYKYTSPINPFRKSVSTKKLDTCIGAIYG